MFYHLTEKQHRILSALDSLTKQLGHPPSLLILATEARYSCAGDCLSALLAKGLVANNGNGHNNYVITNKGRKYLAIYDKAEELLK